MADMQNIQWFPGHMAKTRREIQKYLPLCDAVVEIVDARIPLSSRNPDLKSIIGKTPLCVLLNKCDMADSLITNEWLEYYKAKNIMAIAVDCRSGKGLGSFSPLLKQRLCDKLEMYKKKGIAGKPLRVMVVGIPNVGKSSFINRMSGGAKARVEDRPGVTRGSQWFTVDKQLEMLDTAGVLWPKFDDQTVGEHLAFTGAVKDTVVDIEALAYRLLEYLISNYRQILCERYKLENISDDPYEAMCEIGKKRAMVIRGGEIDTQRTSVMIIDEFRGGKLGKISLERPY